MSASESRLKLGLGLRVEHYEALLARPPLPGLDFFEVVPENFLDFGGLPRRLLRELAGRVPLVTHGISLSLGGPDSLDRKYLEQLAQLLDELDVPWHSDHVCVSSAHGVEYHDLLPVPTDRETLARIARRAGETREFLRRPMLLENATVYTRLPGGQMSEPEFLTGLLAGSGCGLLLDINNVWVDCVNHGGDPVAFLEALPRDCVGQYHLAGYRPGVPLAVDSHASPVAGEVRELYRIALRRFGPAWTLLERDEDVPSLEELLDEIAELRSIAESALRSGPVTVSISRAMPAPALAPGDPRVAAETLHRVAIGEVDPDAAARDLGVPAPGLRLYRRSFERHHWEILVTPYRVLFSLLDEETATRLIRGYQQAHPMSHREINANAGAFPEWLGKRVAAGEPRLGDFHVELAVLERQRFLAYTHGSELPERDRLVAPVLNPTLSILRLAYPVADFVDQWSRSRAAGEPPPPIPSAPLPEPEILLVYRDPETLQGRIVRGVPMLLFAIKMLHEGLDPEEAGRQAGRDASFAAQAIDQAAAAGLVLTPADRIRSA